MNSLWVYLNFIEFLTFRKLLVIIAEDMAESIKVFSVHWSKSRHILVAHVSNKVMNENTLNKIPVCLSVCFRGFREKLFTINLKTAAGIIMKFHIWIRYLLTYVFNYITFWYLDPKMGFGGGRTNGNHQITPKLLTLQQIVSWAKLLGV